MQSGACKWTHRIELSEPESLVLKLYALRRAEGPEQPMPVAKPRNATISQEGSLNTRGKSQSEVSRQ
jgi:hypothetical protein